MKKAVFQWQLFGFALTSFLGTILHFLYEWTNGSTIAALVSGVNESTWEHMKLLFVPMFFYSLIQSPFFRERTDYWCIKLKGMLIGLILIPVIFYNYNGVVGKSPDFINIAIFFISAAVTYFYEWKQFEKEQIRCKHPKLSFVIICVIMVMFVVFTFAAPGLEIFKDPISETYGIS